MPLPVVLAGARKGVAGPKTTAASDEEEIAELFPKTYGQGAISFEAAAEPEVPDRPLRLGIVLSGGQAPGGHSVIAGVYDYVKSVSRDSKLYGFLGGPKGVFTGKYVEVTDEQMDAYRNMGGFDMICSGRDKIESAEHFKGARDTAAALELDGLLVAGGDDSNTNAAVLAEDFKANGSKTAVIGVPKTIDGDLKVHPHIPVSFGFDTACKVYSELAGNVALDALSSRKYYHWIRLMGRAASNITLEVAL